MTYNIVIVAELPRYMNKPWHSPAMGLFMLDLMAFSSGTGIPVDFGYKIDVHSTKLDGDMAKLVQNPRLNVCCASLRLSRL